MLSACEDACQIGKSFAPKQSGKHLILFLEVPEASGKENRSCSFGMGKASIRTTLTLKQFKWTEHILLLLYQFLLMMILSEYINSNDKASIAAM